MASDDVASRVRASMENMRANAESADKQASACDTIADMTLASAATVGSVAGVFDAIVGAMRRHGGAAQVQEHACFALGNLAGSNDANRSAIGSVAGVFDVIVGAMRRHEGVANVQSYGCLVLANLACTNDNRRSIGSVAGVFEVIVGAMRRHEGVANVQSYGCLALANLAHNNIANRSAIGSVAGVFDVIVGAMRRHEGVANVQEHGCMALANLAWNDANRSAIGSVAGVFDAIVRAMRRHEGVADVQENGCLALASLACTNDDNRSAIGSVAGVFEAIVGATRRYEGVAEVQVSGYLALGNLAYNNDANRNAIGSVAGVFDVIVGAMRQHEGVVVVQRSACRALCQLVTCSGSGFLAGLFGWLKSSTEASAEVATAERNATRLAAVAGVKELLQASRLDYAARVLEAMKRAEVARQRAATAKRRIADAERRAREALKRAEVEAKRADGEAKRADVAERRAATLAAPPGPTRASARFAVVMANAAYQGNDAALPCCTRDGDAMEAALQHRGFDVTRYDDAGSDTMYDAVREFGERVAANPGCIAVWYFSGHGFETKNGVVNLVPVDRGDGGAPLLVSSLERALHQYSAEQKDEEAAAGLPSATIIIILDCCRVNENNDTYKGNTIRGTSTRVHIHKGDREHERSRRFKAQYLVAHACESGTVARAEAGGAGLSPFTDALVPPLREGVPLEVALKRATTVVFWQTQRTQRPSYRSSLGWDDEAGAPLVL